ncbi:cuticle protein 1-like [Leguminivora glycinivorella]|uniref:cuticle protein 1-like n=1 Tax=Leguminivora glycinivorella TaxID=1035111 RepID=UPI00200F7453|nr:cuticle protein 1-like [Leguminivora glycinivorella]
MFTKVLVICALAAVALANDFPHGIHPAICPNYPLCDPAVLARHTPEGIPIPDWDLPVVRSAAMPVFEAIRYPADFDPALCPNYPYCF